MSAHSTNAPVFGALRHEGIFHTLLEMIAVRRQRNELAKMDDHILRDIGVTRAQAHAEASRPAWDVPHHWMG